MSNRSRLANLLGEIAGLRLLVTIYSSTFLFAHLGEREWAFATFWAVVTALMVLLTVKAFRAAKRERAS